MGDLNNCIKKNRKLETDNCAIVSHHVSMETKVKDILAEKHYLEKEAKQLTEKDSSPSSPQINQLSTTTSRLSELQSKLSVKIIENDALVSKCHKIERELETMQKKAKEMSIVLSNVEKEKKEMDRREEDAKNRCIQSKEDLEEACLSRDRLNALCMSLRDELSQLNKQKE
eukprot:13976354-Ditylum_brightwellii.AAC.1